LSCSSVKPAELTVPGHRHRFCRFISEKISSLPRHPAMAKQSSSTPQTATAQKTTAKSQNFSTPSRKLPLKLQKQHNPPLKSAPSLKRTLRLIPQSFQRHQQVRTILNHNKHTKRLLNLQNYNRLGRQNNRHKFFFQLNIVEDSRLDRLRIFKGIVCSHRLRSQHATAHLFRLDAF